MKWRLIQCKYLLEEAIFGQFFKIGIISEKMGRQLLLRYVFKMNVAHHLNANA